MTQLQEQLRQVFPTLPDEIKTLLLSADFNDRIGVLTSKYGLGEAESAVVIRIVVRLLSGIITPAEFISVISNNADMELSQAAQLAQEINRDIFNPVKDALKQLHKITSEKKPENPVTTVSRTQLPEITSVAAMKTPEPATNNAAKSITPPRITPEPKPSVPFGAIPATPETKTESNNLESKLGGTFTIKKDVMFTPQSTTPPTAQVVTPPTSKTSTPLPQTAAPAQEGAKVLDPYRELPS